MLGPDLKDRSSRYFSLLPFTCSCFGVATSKMTAAARTKRPSDILVGDIDPHQVHAAGHRDHDQRAHERTRYPADAARRRNPADKCGSNGIQFEEVPRRCRGRTQAGRKQDARQRGEHSHRSENDVRDALDADTAEFGSFGISAYRVNVPSQDGFCGNEIVNEDHDQHDHSSPREALVAGQYPGDPADQSRNKHHLKNEHAGRQHFYIVFLHPATAEDFVGDE